MAQGVGTLETRTTRVELRLVYGPPTQPQVAGLEVRRDQRTQQQSHRGGAPPGDWDAPPPGREPKQTRLA
ncbi:hypothetical protein VULLAG_LOCUS10058 [Vulpes lagopus]